MCFFTLVKPSSMLLINYNNNNNNNNNNNIYIYMYIYIYIYIYMLSILYLQSIQDGQLMTWVLAVTVFDLIVLLAWQLAVKHTLVTQYLPPIVSYTANYCQTF